MDMYNENENNTPWDETPQASTEESSEYIDMTWIRDDTETPTPQMPEAFVPEISEAPAKKPLGAGKIIAIALCCSLIGGILGMLMMLVLAYLGETDLLTPANLFLYELIWLIPGLMATEMTRSI